MISFRFVVFQLQSRLLYDEFLRQATKGCCNLHQLKTRCFSRLWEVVIGVCKGRQLKLRKLKMAFTEISVITPHDNANPIQVRVIRKWIPYGKRQELCYLFVDKQGNAIEAIDDLSHQTHFESHILLQWCYTITNYLSDTARPYMNVVPHPTCIKLGLKTSFVQFNDITIPHHYYNFINYDHLRHRLNNHLLLTDYIGRMDKVSNIINRADKKLLKISVEDRSGNFIEATFWEQIAFSFDKEAALRFQQPVIIAMTSMKVSEYKGTLQLGSTNVTTIVINHEIEDLEHIISSLDLETLELAQEQTQQLQHLSCVQRKIKTD